MAQEVAVNFSDFVQLLDAPLAAQCFVQHEDAFGAWAGDFLGERFVVVFLELFTLGAGSESAEPCFEGTEGLLHGLLEVRTDGHRFAHGLHLGAERRICLRELFEGEARNLYHNVVKRRFKAARGRLRNVVAEFVERVAHGEQRCNLCDGEARCLGGESRRTAHARVHFDDDAAAGLGLDSPLHVRSASFHADGFHDLQGVITHGLVSAVIKALDRGDRDGVAGMHAHRVEVFDGAHDNGIALLVAHDFHLEFFPAEERFFDKHFVVERGVKTAVHDGLEFFFVVGDTAAGTTEGEARTDDERPASDGVGDSGRFAHGVCGTGAGEVKPDLEHGFLEQVTVFGALDGLRLGADEFHLVAVENAAFVEFHGEVQSRLATESREQCIGAFATDDFVQNVDAQRFDVGAVGHFGVGHDGGRVGVHQHHFVAFAAQHLAGLHAGVVEFAALANHDRARTNEHNLLDVGTLRHSFCLHSHSS